MSEKTMRDAINEALHQAMAADDSVFVIGEDVAGGNGSDGTVGCAGGVFGVTAGLYEKYGPLRCIDTPISESAVFVNSSRSFTIEPKDLDFQITIY